MAVQNRVSCRIQGTDHVVKRAQGNQPCSFNASDSPFPRFSNIDDIHWFALEQTLVQGSGFHLPYDRRRWSPYAAPRVIVLQLLQRACSAGNARRILFDRDGPEAHVQAIDQEKSTCQALTYPE